MQESETFFGWQAVRDKLQHKLKALFAQCKEYGKEVLLSTLLR